MYYPHCSIMEAKKGSRPSWLWASILDGRDVIQLGSRWNIASGQLVNVWEDKWIPGLPNFKVQTTVPNSRQFLLVQDLINPLQRTWKLDLLHKLFNDIEVQAIKQIPSPEE